jgi:hypothetical protein
MAQPLPDPKDSKAGCCGGLFFILVALPFLGYFLWQFYKDVRCFTGYHQATCTILGKQLLSDSESGYCPEFEFEFKTEDGQTIRARGYNNWNGWYSSGQARQQAIVDSYAIGKTYPCWYDPRNPSRAVLSRRISWFNLITLFPLLFIVIGVCMMRNARKDKRHQLSPEARLRQAQTSGAGNPVVIQPGIGCLLFSGALMLAGGVVYGLWPNTVWGLALALGVIGLIGALLSFISLISPKRPGDAGAAKRAGEMQSFLKGHTEVKPVETQPGEVLAVALPQENPSRPGIGCLIFAVVLMASGAVIFWQWAPSLWGLALALSVIGFIGFIVTFFSLGSRKRIRRIQVETNAAEVLAGQDLDCFIRLTGQTELNSVTVRLVCEERATYQRGTDTTTEKRKVLEEILAEQSLLQLNPLEPLELRSHTRIPVNAMHSFKSKNNEIAWFIQVNCDIPRWPDSETRYPLIVAPRWGNPDTATEGTDA